jgi:hypothetical protein
MNPPRATNWIFAKKKHFETLGGNSKTDRYRMPFDIISWLPIPARESSLTRE